MFDCGDIAQALTRAGLIDSAGDPTALYLIDTPNPGPGVMVLNHRPAAGE